MPRNFPKVKIIGSVRKFGWLWLSMADAGHGKRSGLPTGWLSWQPLALISPLRIYGLAYVKPTLI